MRREKLGAGALGFALLLGTAGPAGATPPEVVVSIKPVHSLVASVMEEVGRPTLLIEGAASPHSYSLRPSEAEALNRARLIFWVGKGLESFLVAPLEALSDEADIVEIATLPRIELLEAREGGAWEAHGHEAHEHEEGEHEEADAGDEDDHDHAEGSKNLHLWLDPHNAEVIVEAAVEALSAADPANAARYWANGKTAVAGLEALDGELRAALSGIVDVPFVVFHDAYHYFEAHYGLKAVGSIAIGEARAPGVRRLREVRRKIAESGAVCVFSEPQFQPALVATVIEDTPARTGVLDPLGAGLAEGPAAFGQLMRGLAASLVECLSPRS